MTDRTDERAGGEGERVAPRVLLGGASDERLVALARADDEQAFAAQLAAVAGRPLDVSRAERESGDVLNTAADTRRAREELGFAPAMTLADGLRAEYEWVLARSARRPRLAAVGARPG